MATDSAAAGADRASRRRRSRDAAGAAELVRGAPPRPSCREAARPRDVCASRTGSRTGSRATTSCATTSPRTRPHGSRPTSISAASRRARSPNGRSGERAARRSCGSSAGVISTTSCSPLPQLWLSGLPPADARWRDDPEALEAWKQGRTGYPLIDAGMRQLLREGFMHNRARLDRRLVPDQASLDRLARRRRALPRATSWTATSPTTPATGSGSPAPAPTRARTGSQSGTPDAAVRPGRDLRAAMDRRARHRGLSRADRQARAGGRPLPRRGRNMSLRGWETSERVLESGGLESRQRVLVDEPAVEPSEAGARWLGLTYWQAVDASPVAACGRAGATRAAGCGCSAARPCSRSARRSFAVQDGIVSCRYAIEGGLLALRPGGSVTLAQRGRRRPSTSSASPSRSTCRGWQRAPARHGGRAPLRKGARARSTPP